LTRTNIHEVAVPPAPKKSKSKSCDKIKSEKSPNKTLKEKKEKLLTHTLSGMSNDGHDTHKIMSRTGVNVPLPKNHFKSPPRHT